MVKALTALLALLTLAGCAHPEPTALDGEPISDTASSMAAKCLVPTDDRGWGACNMLTDYAISWGDDLEPTYLEIGATCGYRREYSETIACDAGVFENE